MNNLHNRKYLEERRNKIRKNLTPSEATLWKYLQRKQLKRRKFRRQHSIEDYIVDFYCASENLIVELDGAVHLDFAQQNYDYERTQNLETLGFTIVRFENKLLFIVRIQLLPRRGKVDFALAKDGRVKTA